MMEVSCNDSTLNLSRDYKRRGSSEVGHVCQRTCIWHVCSILMCLCSPRYCQAHVHKVSGVCQWRLKGATRTWASLAIASTQELTIYGTVDGST
jgi:hypothetical protein